MNNLPDPVYTIGGVNFPVLVAGKRISARISDEALQDFFQAGADSYSLIEAYRTNSGTIDAKAIERYRVNPNAPVLLTTKDF